jgi:hypothetical protein
MARLQELWKCRVPGPEYVDKLNIFFIFEDIKVDFYWHQGIKAGVTGKVNQVATWGSMILGVEHLKKGGMWQRS